MHIIMFDGSAAAWLPDAQAGMINAATNATKVNTLSLVSASYQVAMGAIGHASTVRVQNHMRGQEASAVYLCPRVHE
jgi:hypothetical protein